MGEYINIFTELYKRKDLNTTRLTILLGEEMEITETERALVVNEALKALRLSRRYRGSKFGNDELEYANILLSNLENGEGPE